MYVHIYFLLYTYTRCKQAGAKTRKIGSRHGVGYKQQYRGTNNTGVHYISGIGYQLSLDIVVEVSHFPKVWTHHHQNRQKKKRPESGRKKTSTYRIHVEQKTRASQVYTERPGTVLRAVVHHAVPLANQITPGQYSGYTHTYTRYYQAQGTTQGKVSRLRVLEFCAVVPMES